MGKKFKYAKVPNSEECNCHKFVCHCLLGEKDDASYLLKDVKEAIYKRYKLSDEKAVFMNGILNFSLAQERRTNGLLQKPRGHV